MESKVTTRNFTRAQSRNDPQLRRSACCSRHGCGSSQMPNAPKQLPASEDATTTTFRLRGPSTIVITGLQSVQECVPARAW